MKRIVYLIFGHIFFVLGVAGAFLPILPTTPFLLLATLFYSKSSPKFYHWIIEHPIIGKPVRDWNESGVIRPWAKILATIMILSVIVLKFQKLNIPENLKIIFSIILIGVLIFIWTRPNSDKIKTL